MGQEQEKVEMIAPAQRREGWLLLLGLCLFFVEMLKISEPVEETSLLYSFFSRIQRTQQVKKTDYIITTSFLFYVAVFVNCETPWEHFAFFLNLAC